MGVSEKLELLGRGLYEDIPDVLTIKSIPTAAELDYVGSEDFESTMVDKIFPKAIEEKIDFRKLLEVDFQWICRALRILNYGPYFTTNTIYCSECGKVSHGEYKVNLTTVEAKPFPENFDNNIVISKDEFIDFNKSITLHMLTVQDILNIDKDPLFTDSTGRVNRQLARICYMIKAIGSEVMAVPQVKHTIQYGMSDADYRLLADVVSNLTDYGLRMGGKTGCPNCHSTEAAYVALVNDKFFRPTLGDLRSWRDDKRSGETKNTATTKTGSV